MWIKFGNGKDKYAEIIRQQWSKMGLSLDYSRERFTLDEGLSDAVREVFVRLYEKGSSIVGNILLTGIPQTRTALSDIEVSIKKSREHFTIFVIR